MTKITLIAARGKTYSRSRSQHPIAGNAEGAGIGCAALIGGLRLIGTDFRMAASGCRSLCGRMGRGADCGFARPALAQFGFDPLAIEVGENGCHRGIQVDRNRLADLDGTIKRAGQRRVFHDRDACRSAPRFLISSASKLRPLASTVGASIVVKSNPSATA